MKINVNYHEQLPAGTSDIPCDVMFMMFMYAMCNAKRVCSISVAYCMLGNWKSKTHFMVCVMLMVNLK